MDGVTGVAHEGDGETESAAPRCISCPIWRSSSKQRLPLRDPEQAPARTELPEQRRAHPPEGRAHRQGRRLFRRRRRAGFVDFINANKSVLHPNIFHATGRPARSRAPTSVSGWPCSGTMRLQRTGAVLHQQHPQRDGGTHLTGLRAAMTRVINKYIDDNEAGQRRPRSKSAATTCAKACAACSASRCRAKFSSQTKDKLVSSKCAPGGRHRQQAAVTTCRSVPRRQDHRRQDRRGRPRPRGRPQGARDDASQGRARRHGPARQTGRLPGKGPGPVRDLHRRGRLGRRLGQAGPRPEVPGHPAAAQQDPQRRKAATRSC